ncbi:MAG TPA: alpha/beta hydrolase domain-containing protein [Ramlibacter sp.]|nr:alpha/beta hydrolase domain-containing protein [Ramlibacter sp.]
MTKPIELTVVERGLFAEGASFGDTGAYERILARATFAADPAAPANAGVFDLALAPRDSDGLVRFATDVWILQPAAPGRGNGAVLFEFPNRGNKRCLQFFNDASGTNDPVTLAHAGNGFLMRQGFTVVSAAWQGDVLPGNGRVVLDLPVGTQSGQPLTAVTRAEFISDVPGVTCFPLSGKNGTRSLPTASLRTGDAQLRRRRYPWSAAEDLPSHAWQFARLEGGGRPGAQGDVTGAEQGIIPSDGHLYLPAGFEPGWIYELVYTARDPLVLDLGMLGVRDLTSFLRHEAGDANPLRQQGDNPKRFYGWGRSQAGRCIRDFIHRGFNADTAGRKVFDGLLPHVSGAGRTNMNRFSNLVIPASRQYEDWLHPADRFPFSYASSVDHITGAQDAILKRPATDPYVIHTHTASEYWYRRGSLVHTDTRGNDLPQPDNVRIYFWASSQHWADPQPGKPPRGVCHNWQNAVATSAFFRSTLMLMERWARDGIAPPPSEIPRRADGTLVDMAGWRKQFPAIPGIATPARPNELPCIDYGSEMERGGPCMEPPMVDSSRSYAVLVPAVDGDGNDVAGLRAPMVSAPLGTYTGWNLRIAGHGAGALHDFSGSTIPLPDTPEERELLGDPRPSVLERYQSSEGYEVALRAAAAQLAERGFYLQEDVQRTAETGKNWGKARHHVHL